MTIELITPERLSEQQFAADSVPVAHIWADNWGWSSWKPYALVLWLREVEIGANASRPPH